LNGRTRKKWYRYIAQRDGEYCKCCGKLPSEGQLIVDHRDNNPINNSPENLQILCRACNFLKNPRRPLDQCVRTSGSETLYTNRVKEPRFREYVYSRLEDERYLEYDKVIYDGAEEVGISPETAKRYLRKMCSDSGKLERVRQNLGDFLYGKPVLCVKFKEIDNQLRFKNCQDQSLFVP